MTNLFEHLQTWARRFPDRPAHRVASAGTTPTPALTYAELLARARADAAHLRAGLPDNGSPVLVVGHKEPEMLAGFLGAVGCGHPYVPVFVGWMRSEHALTEGAETFLNQAPFSFDLSVMDLYLSLGSGGTLHSITRREVADFRRLYRALSGAGLTAWVSTPPSAQLCLAERTFAAERLPALRRFLFCGETLLPDTAARLLERFPQAEVWNTYGPTEATVATTSVRVTAELMAQGGPLPIGFPRPGTTVFLQDAHGDNPPPDERGEIVIAGPNVSPGYLGAPGLTARAFFYTPDGRAYRTGDWGRVRGGMFYFEGRQDEQIKLHGYRIELTDIEANLRALPSVQDDAVVPVVRPDAVQFLAAFVVLADGLPVDDAENASTADRVRAALSERLPAYMLPRKFYLRIALTITANGKVDRCLLATFAANGNRSTEP